MKEFKILKINEKVVMLVTFLIVNDDESKTQNKIQR